MRGAGGGKRLRAAGLREGRGLPVRLERGRLGGPQHLRPGAVGAHEAVRQPRLLAYGVLQPGPREAARRPRPQLCRARRRAPARNIDDNMQTAVDRVRKKARGARSRRASASCCAHCLYDPHFCNVASGWEKGLGEENVQHSRRHPWLDAERQRLGSFTGLTAWLAERCRALWGESRHPQHSSFSDVDDDLAARILQQRRPVRVAKAMNPARRCPALRPRV